MFGTDRQSRVQVFVNSLRSINPAVCIFQTAVSVPPSPGGGAMRGRRPAEGERLIIIPALPGSSVAKHGLYPAHFVNPVKKINVHSRQLAVKCF